jgi:outer membrane immunogenic protein
MGFNRRAGNFVFGLEADIQTRVDGGSKTSFDPPAIFNFDYTASLDVAWFGTLRGRVGYARDRTLIYATGGLAFGEVNYSARYLITEPCCSGGFANLKSSGVETGYVIGGGLEHAINPNWSLKLEYQYINLGSGKAEAPLFFANGSPSGEGRLRYGFSHRTLGPELPLPARARAAEIAPVAQAPAGRCHDWPLSPI